MLPRCEMLRILLSLVDSGSSRVSNKAGQALVQVCRCANGDDGCTLADPEEIELLMTALTSANALTRHISLVVSPFSLVTTKITSAINYHLPADNKTKTAATTVAKEMCTIKSMRDLSRNADFVQGIF